MCETERTCISVKSNASRCLSDRQAFKQANICTIHMSKSGCEMMFELPSKLPREIELTLPELFWVWGRFRFWSNLEF
jgi:hypothetical protein